MAIQKQEAVTVSIHYLMRVRYRDDGSPVVIPFREAAVEQLYAAIKAKPPFDYSDQEAADRLRLREEAPIDHIEKIDDRTLFGTFKAGYWGHAYDNTAKGRIPADSISLRPFHFLVYLSDNGRIYIASQYLGLFGGYQVLRKTISLLLGEPKSIESYSYKIGAGAYKNAIAKEIRVSFSSKSPSISSNNVIGDAGMIVFRKRSKHDGFEEEISKKLIPAIGKSQTDVRKAVASLANQSELLALKDTDIEDCTVIASVNGKRKVIYLLESGSHASRFPLDVKVDKDGHPIAAQTKAAMLAVLEDEIISRQ